MGERVKEALKQLWKIQFENGTISEEDAEGIDRELLEKVEGKKGYRLSREGRKTLTVVACGGAFDILHPGHVLFLEKAREFGDLLVVIVARDSTVIERKRIPIVPEQQRIEMVRALKPVDIAILGNTKDHLRAIEEVVPEVIVLGPNQDHEEEVIRKELEERGLNARVERVYEYRECPLHSTRQILQKVIERGYPDKRYESAED